jgi:hypothetical protein
MSTTPTSKLTRRAALARLGLVTGAAYAAPAMIGFDAARASGNSGASAASRASGPSRSSRPSRLSGPSGMSRPSRSASNRNGSTWRNSYPSRPRTQRRLTPAEQEAVRIFRQIFGG